MFVPYASDLDDTALADLQGSGEKKAPIAAAQNPVVLRVDVLDVQRPWLPPCSVPPGSNTSQLSIRHGRM